MGEEKDKK